MADPFQPLLLVCLLQLSLCLEGGFGVAASWTLGLHEDHNFVCDWYGFLGADIFIEKHLAAHI
jgi:hypothetical protein